MILNIPSSIFPHLSLSIIYTDTKITNIEFISTKKNNKFSAELSSDIDITSLEQQIKYQFKQYFLSSGFQFSLDFQFIKGTEFQQKVWHALTEIPIGKLMTYGQLAKKLNSSPRAVGNACRNNPLPIIVPCHRIVSASGIGGYAGDTLTRQNTDIDFLAIKKWLLSHERAGF